jgi:8-amino-7-oxononanoate synthase
MGKTQSRATRPRVYQPNVRANEDADAWMAEELAGLAEADLLRVRRRLQSSQGPRVRLGKSVLVNFSSNDYLNLAADRRLARAAARAAKKYGTGAGASPLISGLLPPLRKLERDLARWEGTEAALVFPSGFAANLAVVSAVAGREDAIYSAEHNHASLIDGCRLSRASTHIYRNLNHLAELLRKGRSARRRVIVTDTVFSMDGNLAPLADLIGLAETHDCLLVLDEAHATGVLGDTGTGLTELVPEAKRAGSRVIKVGTLSKALGSQGGFVCGTQMQINWLLNHARPYIFSTALTPTAAAAARRAIAIVETEPKRRRHLHRLTARLGHRLAALGLGSAHPQTPIVPIIVGDARRALELSEKLQERGLLVPAIRPPSVPEGSSRLRISLTAGHTSEDVERLAEELEKAKITTKSHKKSRK